MYSNVKDTKMGRAVTVHNYVNVYGCEIGERTTLGSYVEVQKNATIGKNCKISSHSFICEGVTIEDEVFVGHGVMFINDKKPKACIEDGSKQQDGDWQLEKTIVKKGASIGSNATILCGIEIGESAIVGAGSVVTKNVPANTTVYGNPAKPKV